MHGRPLFPLTDNPCCPLDGWSGPAAETALRILRQIPGPPSLAALADAGLPADAISALLVAEIPDGQPVPFLLRPWLEGEPEAR